MMENHNIKVLSATSQLLHNRERSARV